MSSQNPVFIPGPTNIPERLRHAVNVPTIDHRSADFGRMFRPLFAGVKEIREATQQAREARAAGAPDLRPPRSR